MLGHFLTLLDIVWHLLDIFGYVWIFLDRKEYRIFGYNSSGAWAWIIFWISQPPGSKENNVGILFLHHYFFIRSGPRGCQFGLNFVRIWTKFWLISEPILGSKTGPLRGPVSSENTRNYNGFCTFGRSKMEPNLDHFGGHFGVHFWCPFQLISLALNLRKDIEKKIIIRYYFLN